MSAGGPGKGLRGTDGLSGTDRAGEAVQGRDALRNPAALVIPGAHEHPGAAPRAHPLGALAVDVGADAQLGARELRGAPSHELTDS